MVGTDHKESMNSLILHGMQLCYFVGTSLDVQYKI